MAKQDDASATAPLKRDGLSGLEYLRAVQDGRIPQSGMAVTMGWRIASLEVGKVEFVLPLAPHLFGNNGLHGGTMACLLDGAFAAAVNSSLPADRRCKTLEIKVNYVRGVTTATPEIVAKAHVVQAGRSNAFVEACVEDPDGKLLATGTATFGLMTITRGA